MQKAYVFRVWNDSTTAVEFTASSSHLRNAPVIAGQEILPLEGRSESRPTKVEVLDEGDFFTFKLSSAGRLALMRRLADIQVAVDGSTFATIYTGRIDDIQDFVSHYDVSLQDERHIERTATIFDKVGSAGSTVGITGQGASSQYAGTILFPGGPDGDYGPFAFSYVERTTGAPGVTLGPAFTVGNLLLVGLDHLFVNGFLQPHNLYVTNEHASLIRDDLKEQFAASSSQALLGTNTTAGHFNTLRCRVSGVEREVYGFGTFGLSGGVPIPPRNGDELTSVFDEVLAELRESIFCWVVSTSGAPSSITEAKLVMPEHEPTPFYPLHIGGRDGIHPFKLVQDVYDHIGVRFSTSTLANLQADALYQPARWRVHRKHTAAEWLEDHIYKVYGVVPFVDSEGKVAPRRVWMPDAQEVPNTTALPLFTSTGTADAPNWRHTSREQVTEIEIFYTEEEAIDDDTTLKLVGVGRGTRGIGSRTTLDFAGRIEPPPPDFGADLIKETMRSVVKESTRWTGKGVHKRLDIQADGFHSAGRDVTLFEPETGGLPRGTKFIEHAHFNTLGVEIFDRYADGALRGTITPLSSSIPSSSGIQPGDYFRISIPIFPDPETGARGGTRIVQAMAAPQPDPAGPTYDWLDAGPSLQPLTTPTVTIATATSDARHSLIANVTGMTTGASYQLAIARSSATPASSFAGWRLVVTGTTANSTGISIRNLASGSTWFARARQSQAQRLRSGWSTAATAETTSLTAPSGLATSGVGTFAATARWTNGEAAYPVEVLLDQASTCATATLDRIARLDPGSDRYEIQGLVANSTHCVAVRHRDDYGGVSANASLSFQTLSTADAETAPSLQRTRMVLGTVCT